MKSFKEFLLETPLPDDWDGDVFDPKVSFAKRVEYAKSKAQKIGSGSSRIAFIIPYQGRKTVLKVAKNAKGMAQNEAESEFLEDWYLSKLGITIPMIDYDEKSSRPTWIHTEFATKAKDSDFKNACGGTLGDLIKYCAIHTNRKDTGLHGNPAKINNEAELTSAMMDLVGSYDQIPLGDLSRLANWGIYKGDPVIIDLGLSSDVLTTYYSR